MSANVRCNNDGKLLTNREATKNVSMYVAYYQSKKHVSRGCENHAFKNECTDNLLERQSLLIFRLVRSIKWEQELAAPMAISYLIRTTILYLTKRSLPIYRYTGIQ